LREVRRGIWLQMSTRPACQSALCPLSRKSSPGNVHHSRESASRNSRALETRQRDRMNYRSGHGGQKYEATSPPWKQTPNLRSQKLCVKSEHLRTFETRAEELAASCPLTPAAALATFAFSHSDACGFPNTWVGGSSNFQSAPGRASGSPLCSVCMGLVNCLRHFANVLSRFALGLDGMGIDLGAVAERESPLRMLQM